MESRIETVGTQDPQRLRETHDITYLRWHHSGESISFLLERIAIRLKFLNLDGIIFVRLLS
jgi:hypothetical protein